MPQGLSAPPPNGLPGPAPHQATTKATGRVPQHPHARGHENVRPGAAVFSQPGTAPPELEQHREPLVGAEPGPPRSQRHHERAGRRLYKRIEAVAATIEAEWAGAGRGAAAGGAAHHPQRSAGTPAGPAGKAAALNPRAPTATWALPGGPAWPPRRSFPRSASASAADRSRLWDGRRGARCSHRPGAGVVAAGGEGQRGGEQCGGDDGPQQQHGLLPAQPRVQAARLRTAVARRGCRRARRGRRTAGRPRRPRVSSRAGISSPAASRLKILSMEASRGSEPARPSAMEPRACRSSSVMLIIITSDAGT